MFCEETLGKIKCGAFPERVGPQISVDYFRTSKHFSGRKKKRIIFKISKTLIVSVVNFHGMEMSLVMSMRFIFGDDWNDAPCSHHVFHLWQCCNFSRIEALESFLYDCLISIFEFSVVALTNVNNDVNNNAATWLSSLYCYLSCFK